ncbi:MAG: type II secretion system protein, partial [Opitutales bacterium]
MAYSSTVYPPSPCRHQARTRGFTLIELLMVIAVIMLLAGLTFGISTGVRNAQARAEAKGELATLQQGLERFKSQHGDYPWVEEADLKSKKNA